MLKNIHKIKLNSLSNNMLRFWEKDFEKAISKHIKFLKENLEFQNNYSLKFSEILQEMEILNNDEKVDNNENDKDNDQNNPSNDDQNAEQEDLKDQNQQEDAEASLDADYDIDEYKLDDQLADNETETESEQIVKKALMKLI